MFSFSSLKVQIQFCMSSNTSLLILTIKRYYFMFRIASLIQVVDVAVRLSLFFAIQRRLRHQRINPYEQEFQTKGMIQIITVIYLSFLAQEQLFQSFIANCAQMLMFGQFIQYKIKINSKMVKEGKQGGVARSKFIDRIKSRAELQFNHKENMNLNDIRQSGYKLPSSKSNSRYDHSLQRKQPLKINKDTLNNSAQHNLMEMTLKGTLKQYASYAPTNNNTIKLDQYQPYSSFSDEKIDLSGREGGQCSGRFNQMQLQQQEQALDIIKSIWYGTVKMKDRGLFKDQMSRIQGILKQIIVQMAKPSFNALQQNSSMSLKVPQVKNSPFQTITSAKQQKNPSNNNSISEYRAHTKRQEQGRYLYTNESQAEDELQFKKIMYILEEKSKLTRIMPEYSSNGKEGRELKQISDFINIKNSCYSSSFNSSERDFSGKTVRQFQKVSNSQRNQKVFLKNIVKKAKNSVSNVEDSDRIIYLKPSRSDVSYLNDHEQKLNQTISEQEQPSQQQLQQSYVQLSSSSQQYKSQTKYPFIGSKADPIKIETLQTLQDESQSKRAVLNQIIAMLNNKYHKNIKLQPRKF